MQVLLRINRQCGSKGGEFHLYVFFDLVLYILLTHSMLVMKLKFHKRVLLQYHSEMLRWAMDIREGDQTGLCLRAYYQSEKAVNVQALASQAAQSKRTTYNIVGSGNVTLYGLKRFHLHFLPYNAKIKCIAMKPPQQLETLHLVRFYIFLVYFVEHKWHIIRLT